MKILKPIKMNDGRIIVRIADSLTSRYLGRVEKYDNNWEWSALRLVVLENGLRWELVGNYENQEEAISAVVNAAA